MTQNPTKPCPIWGDQFEATCGEIFTKGTIVVLNSPRVGGGFEITDQARDAVGRMADREKAQLTTMIVDMHRQGVKRPYINTGFIERVKQTRPLSVSERALNLLRFLIANTGSVGEAVYVEEATYLGTPGRTDLGSWAWSESISQNEVDFMLDYLAQQGWISNQRTIAGDRFVTVDGHAKIDTLVNQSDSGQCFVAMWFGNEMNDAYEQGIKPGIEEAGFKAMRIDRKPDVQKIDDEIMAEIRRSRFLVADMTSGGDGARGGVYFEAGLAFGLGQTVIFSCHKNSIEKVHFDIRQYYHIVWENPDDLKDTLTKRIGALIGPGPSVS